MRSFLLARLLYLGRVLVLAMSILRTQLCVKMRGRVACLNGCGGYAAAGLHSLLKIPRPTQRLDAGFGERDRKVNGAVAL